MRLILKNRYIIISDNTFKIFVLADLHLGLEQQRRRRGIQFARISQKVLAKLISDIEREKPSHVFILGDIKESIGYKTSKEEFLLRNLFSFLSEQDILCKIARGNHDADLSSNEYASISLSSPQGFSFPISKNKSIGFAHGHAFPSKAYETHTFLLILGHLHPVVQLSEDHVDAIHRLPVFLRTNKSSELTRRITQMYPKTTPLTSSILQEILILPAYNEFLGGSVVNFSQDSIRKGFCSQLLRNFDFEVILTTGTVLGKISDLST